jgi:8-oxo-(d)GTP phosphatase
VTVATPPVLAAGALCWRVVNGKLRVLVIYRGDRADVSLPKGKVDPGESLPQTAVREIAEETGLAIVLGAPLGTVDYQLPNGRDKVVYYWAAEVDDEAIAASTFAANSEVASLAWVSVKKARATLSYPHDHAVLDRFEARLAAGNARTFAIVALRHGKAVPPEMWDGPDSTRPLMQRGQDQAASVAPGIAAYGPRKLISSTAARCLATIEPLAQLIGRPVTATAAISQEAHEYGQSDVGSVLLKRLASKKTAVLCSHGPVLPEIIAEVARLSGATQQPALRGAAALSTGEYTVLHLSVENPTGGIVAIETHGPASA